MIDSLEPARAGARSFAGDDDLDLLYRFASRCLKERFPLEAAWHPGDIAWQYFTDGINPPRDPKRDVKLWFQGGELAAVAWLYDPEGICCEILSSLGNEALFREVIAWGESSARHAGVRALDRDTSRTKVLAELGYMRTNQGATIFRRSLEAPIEEALLPPGFVIRDCANIEIDKRVECHRDAWSHLEEIGILGVQSKFSHERYLKVASSRPYDPKLDIVIEAPDGRLVANCTCWADRKSGIGTCEPVGTAGGFRRHGLARTAILEGARRLRTAGMKWARVSTNLINKPAYATYRAVGFEVIDERHLWRRMANSE